MALVPFSHISFEAYNSTSRRLIGIATVELGELSFKTTDIAGAGILGSYEVAVLGHLDNIEAKITFRTLFGDATDFLSLNAHNLTLYSAYEVYDAGAGKRKTEQLKIVMRGLTKSVNLGKMESGEKSDTEITLSLDYLKITTGGKAVKKKIVEIDKFNYLYVVNGIDQTSDLRSALGL